MNFLVAFARFDGNSWKVWDLRISADLTVDGLVLRGDSRGLYGSVSNSRSFSIGPNGGQIQQVDENVSDEMANRDQHHEFVEGDVENDAEEPSGQDRVREAYAALQEKPEYHLFERATSHYRGQVWWVREGEEATGPLRWRTYCPPAWGDEHRFPNTVCGDLPSLTVFAGQLYCLHRGVEQGQRVYWSATDGVSWTTAHSSPFSTSYPPACLVVGGALWSFTVTRTSG